MSVKVELKEYGIFGKCLRISNDTVELYASTEFGPRILHYSFIGGENLFFQNTAGSYLQSGPEFDELYGKGAQWNVYGGNRLWKCPHDGITCFYPDNKPIEYETLPDGVRLRAPVQSLLKIENTVELHLAETGSRVSMSYAITNRSEKEQRLACWPLCVCRVDGKVIFPQTQKKTRYLPNRHITLWDYADMSDSRVRWGKKYVTLTGDANRDAMIKIGINNEDGWALYLRGRDAFLHRFPYVEGGEYADFGVNYETYANKYFMETESISPLKALKTGDSVEQSETWELFKLESEPDVSSEDKIDELVSRLA